MTAKRKREVRTLLKALEMEIEALYDRLSDLEKLRSRALREMDTHKCR